MIDGRTLVASDNRRRAYQAKEKLLVARSWLNDPVSIPGHGQFELGHDALVVVRRYWNEDGDQIAGYTLTLRTGAGKGIKARTDSLDWPTVARKLARAIDRKVARLERAGD
jgi:hypothetical protein